MAGGDGGQEGRFLWLDARGRPVRTGEAVRASVDRQCVSTRYSLGEVSHGSPSDTNTTSGWFKQRTRPEHLGPDDALGC